MKHGIAEHLVGTARDDSSLNGIDACAQDIEKLYCRLRQLEARLVSQTKILQAKLEEKAVKFVEESNSLRTKSFSLQDQVDKHQGLLDDMSRCHRSSEDKLHRLVGWDGSGDAEGDQSFSSGLVGRCAKLEVSVHDMGNRFERMLSEHIEDVEIKLREPNSTFEESYVGLQETLHQLKTQQETNGHRIRDLDGKVALEARELKQMSKSLLQHGISLTTESISDRAGLTESRLAALETSLQALDAALKDSCVTFHQGLHDVKTQLTQAEKLQDERLIAVKDQCQELSESRSAISKMVQEFQKTMPLDAGDDQVHPQRESGVQNLISLQTTQESAPQNMEKASPRSGLAIDLRTLASQVQSLLRWQEDMREDVNKVFRLGRIFDDKVEAFDVIEHRMEQLWDQVQGLENNDPQLRNGHDSAGPGGRDAQRSPSPKQASGAWWNRVLRPDEETCMGKSHFASPNFDGTGWAKSPPRRPYSAGAACNADKPQQPQSQPPQSAQKLAPRRPYSAGAVRSAEKPPQPLLQPQENLQSAQPRMPPTLGSVLGGALAPPVGGMHTFCRTGAQATSPKTRALTRPMSARAASERCAW